MLEHLETRLAPAGLNEAIQNAIAADPSSVSIGFQFFGPDFVVVVNGEFVDGGTGLDGNVRVEDISDITIQGDDRVNSITIFGFNSNTKPAAIPITINAAGGNDSISVSAINGGRIIVNGGDGDDDISGRDTLINAGGFEADGGPGDDSIAGTGGNDIIKGGPGNDDITLSPGDDQIEGNDGDDTIRFFGSADGTVTIDGGPGNDLYEYSGLPFAQNTGMSHTILDSGESDVNTLLFSDRQGHRPNNDFSQPEVGVNINLAGTTEVVPGVLTMNLTASGINNVRGTPLSDTIVGNDLDNIIDGGGITRFNINAHNFDNLSGAGGNDVLISEIDLFNRQPTDTNGDPRVGATLDGGPGDDLLVSTLGDDILRGGPGNDTYLASAAVRNGHDTIEEAGECLDTDTLDLIGIIDPPIGSPIFPPQGGVALADFTLDFTSTDRQTAIVAGVGQPLYEVTLDNGKGLERAAVRTTFDGTEFVSNPACELVELDLQIRAEHERDEDFANEQRQEEQPSGDQIESLTLPQGVPAKFLVKVENPDDAAAEFDVSATETKPAGWTITYTDTATQTDITSDITGGGFITRTLNANEELIIAVEMVADANVPHLDKASTQIEIFANGEALATDAVQAETVAGLVVNTEGDDSDANVAIGGAEDGVPDVDVNTPGLQTTLRAALEFVKSIPTLVAPTITFADNVATIQVGGSGNGALPTVTDPLTIDGTDAVNLPRIVVNGQAAGADVNGIEIVDTDNVTIKGLVINSFDGHGILIQDSADIVLQSNFIGTTFSGTVKAPNGGDGVHVNSSEGVEIGGDSQQNLGLVISGNQGNGIHFRGTTPILNIRHNVWGNIIGLDRDGDDRLGNDNHGIFIDNVGKINIGQAGDGGRNVISGNGRVITDNGEQQRVGDGVHIAGNEIIGVGDLLTIQLFNNRIGTNKNGDQAIGNEANGVQVAAGGNSQVAIGDSNGKDNLISGNHLSGVLVDGNDKSISGPSIEANIIGLDASGAQGLGNLLHGVFVKSAGSAFIADNVISGNGPEPTDDSGAGDGIRVEGSETGGIAIVGNRIGTNKSGTGKVANAGNGIQVTGGTTRLMRIDGENLISGNAKHGVLLSGVSEGEGSRFDISDNTIGADATGTQKLGNGGAGIHITGSSDIVVSKNLLSGNGKSGAELVAGSSKITFRDNTIGLNIDADAALGNDEDGILIAGGSTDNRIGENPVAKTPNRIGGNQGAGVRITGANTNGNVVEDNLIGITTPDVQIGNLMEGVVIEAGARLNTIGTLANLEIAAQIVNNGSHGIRVSDASDTTIISNRIVGNGTNNLGNGILIQNSSNTTTTKNDISFNQENGVLISAFIGDNKDDAEANRLEENRVASNEKHGIVLFGEKVSKTVVVGNFVELHGVGDGQNTDHDGIVIENSSNNFVGTRLSIANSDGQSNHLSSNHNGIRIAGTAQNNAILGNSFGSGTFANRRLDIDLSIPGEAANGVNPIDQDSLSSTLANHEQNAPQISFGSFDGDTQKPRQAVAIQGTLSNTFPNTEFLIQFYSGKGDLIHTRKIRTDGNGFDRFTTTFTLPKQGVFDAAFAENVVQATASPVIRANGGSFSFETSEFSQRTTIDPDDDLNNDGIIDGFTPDGDDGDELGIDIAQLLAANENNDQELVELVSAPIADGDANGQAEKGELQNANIVPIPTTILQQIQNEFPEVQLVAGVIVVDVKPREDGKQIVTVKLPPGFEANRYLKLKENQETGELELVVEDGQLKFFDRVEDGGPGAKLITIDEATNQLGFELILEDGDELSDLDQIANGIIKDPGIAVLVPEADLTLSKTDDADPIQVGDNLTYTLTVTNNGPDEAVNVVLTDTLPAGVTVQNLTASQGQIAANNGIVTANLGNLANGGTATVTITVQANTAGELVNNAAVVAGTFDIFIDDNSATETTTVEDRLLNLRAVGAPPGQQPLVRVLDSEGNEVNSFLAYGPAFLGGVNAVVADVNGDGVPDIVTGAGPGGGPHVKVFDGNTGAEIHSFMAYDIAFTGGVHVAAGDINRDGKADIITGAGPGGGPHVRVFDGATGNLIREFMAFDIQFLGGVHVASDDIDGDGTPDLLIGAGAGGGPHVRVFSGAGAGVIRDFFAFDTGFAGGVFVAAGDRNNDGNADVIVAAGPGGGSQIRVFDGQFGAELENFFAFNADFTGSDALDVLDGDDGLVDIFATAVVDGNAVERVFG